MLAINRIWLYRTMLIIHFGYLCTLDYKAFSTTYFDKWREMFSTSWLRLKATHCFFTLNAIYSLEDFYHDRFQTHMHNVKHTHDTQIVRNNWCALWLHATMANHDFWGNTFVSLERYRALGKTICTCTLNKITFTPSILLVHFLPYTIWRMQCN